MALSLVIFAAGLFCQTGCGGPGEVIEGKASNADFAKSGTSDKQGREAPDGTAHID
jgi:hypothetical protein